MTHGATVAVKLPPATAVLRDGSTVTIRPITPADTARLQKLLESLSTESRVFRFFSGGADMETMAKRLAVVAEDGFGLLAVIGPDDEPVGHAMFGATRPGRAEIGFAVADAYQGRGLGTLLLGELVDAARRAGIETLEAVVLPENARMIDVFARSGFPLRTSSHGGQVAVEFPSVITPAVLQLFEGREALATAAAVRHVLEPESIAVIGASRRRGSIGAEVFHNLLEAGFRGPVYPINRSAETIQSAKAFRSIEDVPQRVELAVIAVPADQVLAVAQQCAAHGVRALVVLSAGFGERGDAGLQRQRELLDLCRRTGMRLVGPNCMGVLNTAPEVSLNATFAPTFPPAGNVAFMSQSGGLGLAVIEHATRLGLGLSQFVSVGNKADLSGNDFLQYWETDPATDVILLYLESFGNPRKFSRLARRIARTKPIVAVKSGRTAAGARGTSSHTGALLAASDTTVDALFRQAGVIRTRSLHEMFDTTALLAHQPLPAGPRVGIVTNGGGPGILCADACVEWNLTVPEPSAALRERLQAALPAGSSLSNPVDMLAEARGEHYREAISILTDSGEFDAIVAVFVPPLVTSPEEVAAGIRAGAESAADVTLAAVFLSARGVPESLESGGRRIPSFEFPEDAAAALGHAARLSAWRGTVEGAPVAVDAEVERAADAIRAGLARGVGWLDRRLAARLLASYGIPLVDTREVVTAEEAARAAHQVGFPVALKALADDVLHKTEAGAVRLGARTEAAVRKACEEMRSRLESTGHRVRGFTVQPMVAGGVEMIVGLVQDPLFGPVLACGAGGTAVELTRDVAVALAPVTDVESSAMIRSLRTFPLLEGFRGAPPADTSALETIIHRVSALAERHPEVAELDLNPVIVGPAGAVVVDARVRLAPADPSPPFGAR
ncbi:MAG TPA: GNAT family N-acetyltransferase [Candidatus Dormibacteraeota bacterium]